MLKDFYKELDGLYAQGDQENVERFLLQNASATCPCCGKFNETYLACMSELGAFYRGASKYEASIEAFMAAENMIVTYLGESTPEYATNTNNMAGTYRLKGDYEKALKLFMKAKTIYEDTIGKQNYEYASVLNNVSLLFQSTKEYDKAVDYLQQAIEAMKEIPDAVEELATGYSNLATLLLQKDEPDKARSAIDEALRLMPEDSFHYPAVLNTIAALEYSAGNYDEALKYYLQTLEKVQAFFQKNVEYAITCENIKRVYETIGEYEKAMPYMREAYEVYQKIYGDEHEVVRRAAKEMNELGNKTGQKEK